MTPFVLGIAGGTASGKTTVAERLAARVGAALITYDRYYRDAPDPSNTNFDHPDALETERFVAHLDALRRGEAVDLPVYDFATHRRTTQTDRVEPKPIVIIEGILLLHDPALRARMDLRVFVHAADDLRLIRRLRRDVAERGRSVEGVLTQWLTTVRPMHLAFVAPSRAHAALVLDGEGPLDVAVDALVAHLPG